MSARLPIDPSTIGRTVKNRFAAVAYPRLYQARARIPRYSLQEQAKVFCRLAEDRGLGDLSLYYWYHAVDLGDGLVTPGTHDYRRSLDAFGFPEDMRGMSVLDVGSATGFFAFEFEKRGADVVSVEVPSVEQMDRFPGQRPEQVVEKIAAMTAGQSSYTTGQFAAVFEQASLADFYHYFLDGPFRVCHSALGSQVKRCYACLLYTSPSPRD